MTVEEKQLLLKELSGRLYCGVKVRLNLPESMENGYTLKEINTEGDTVAVFLDREEKPMKFAAVRIENEDGEQCIKPYLRPMSSMTEKEQKEFGRNCGLWKRDGGIHFINRLPNLPNEFANVLISEIIMTRAIDWLNEHHFDYRGLIEKGLALEAPDGMYKTE